MIDKYETLEEIFKQRIEQVKKMNYDELVKICEQENLDYTGLDEKDLKVLLIAFYNEEIED